MSSTEGFSITSIILTVFTALLLGLAIYQLIRISDVLAQAQTALQSIRGHRGNSGQPAKKARTRGRRVDIENGPDASIAAGDENTASISGYYDDGAEDQPLASGVQHGMNGNLEDRQPVAPASPASQATRSELHAAINPPRNRFLNWFTSFFGAGTRNADFARERVVTPDSAESADDRMRFNFPRRSARSATTAPPATGEFPATPSGPNATGRAPTGSDSSGVRQPSLRIAHREQIDASITDATTAILTIAGHPMTNLNRTNTAFPTTTNTVDQAPAPTQPVEIPNLGASHDDRESLGYFHVGHPEDAAARLGFLDTPPHGSPLESRIREDARGEDVA